MTKFTATFTLSQDGLEGDVTSSLKFDPLPPSGEEVASYEIMSHLVEQYLYMVGVTDEDGNLIVNTTTTEDGTVIVVDDGTPTRPN